MNAVQATPLPTAGRAPAAHATKRSEKSWFTAPNVAAIILGAALLGSAVGAAWEGMRSLGNVKSLANPPKNYVRNETLAGAYHGALFGGIVSGAAIAIEHR